VAEVLHQRVPLTMCARCRKQLRPGDRVLTAMIIQKVGYNPETKDVGAFLGADFELVHASCPDPALEGKILVLG
jgi:hypothetical protein